MQDSRLTVQRWGLRSLCHNNMQGTVLLHPQISCHR